MADQYFRQWHYLWRDEFSKERNQFCRMKWLRHKLQHLFKNSVKKTLMTPFIKFVLKITVHCSGKSNWDFSVLWYINMAALLFPRLLNELIPLSHCYVNFLHESLMTGIMRGGEAEGGGGGGMRGVWGGNGGGGGEENLLGTQYLLISVVQRGRVSYS